ncbi:MAG: CDP-alcohol phosphatidyltransferase family protein [Candidatus Thiodiazotropha sp.]
MATIYDLKPRFQALLRPLNATLVRLGISANMVTLAALLLSLLLGMALALSPQNRLFLLLMPVWLFLRMALNAIDGMLAREHDMQSRLGAVLNEMGDVLSDAALYLPLALVPGVPAMAVVLTVLLSVMVEMVGVVSVQIGGSRRYDGPFGKSDRAFAFGLLCLLLGLGVPLGSWIDWLLWALVLASALTLFNRAKKALAEAPHV